MLRRALTFGLAAVLVAAMAFAAGCVPADDAGGDFTTSIWPMLIFIVLLFGLMYFLMIRPQRRRQREHMDLLQQLQKGDKVITAGGIYGQIESIADQNVVLKIESGATIRIARTSIVAKQGEPEATTG